MNLRDVIEKDLQDREEHILYLTKMLEEDCTKEFTDMRFFRHVALEVLVKDYPKAVELLHLAGIKVRPVV